MFGWVEIGRISIKYWAILIAFTFMGAGMILGSWVGYGLGRINGHMEGYIDGEKYAMGLTEIVEENCSKRIKLIRSEAQEGSQGKMGQ